MHYICNLVGDNHLDLFPGKWVSCYYLLLEIILYQCRCCLQVPKPTSHWKEDWGILLHSGFYQHQTHFLEQGKHPSLSYKHKDNTYVRGCSDWDRGNETRIKRGDKEAWLGTQGHKTGCTHACSQPKPHETPLVFYYLIWIRYSMRSSAWP